MSLEAGARLGPYDVLSPLGAGGMGEVYRARDTRLGRTVALKVLRQDIAQSEEGRARLAREARTISNIDHPHICTLYDVGREEGVDFLVMQLVEGETLAERLKKGPLPIEDALRHGIEIADALAAAHRAGIVHRDLKPGNIMLSKKGAVVLDFGLARLYWPGSGSLESEGVTEEFRTKGVVAGTPHYMPPEQVQGKAADHRSDIFALGAVLYAMVTASRPFQGRNPSEVFAAILDSTPSPTTSLNTAVPEGLEHIIRRCLAKDPDERWQSAIDVREELSWVRHLGGIASPEALPGKSAARPWALLALGLFIGAALAGALRWWTAGPPATMTAPGAHFTIEMTGDVSLSEYSTAPVAFSPDGTRIAYVANRGAERAIYVRAIDEVEPRRIAKTERARSPCFSPDGEWILFASGGRLKKVHVMGGTPETLTHVSWFAGASWGPDGTIVYTPNFMRGLHALPPGGGAPRRLTTPAPTEAHVWPWVLPDGETVLFTIWTGESWDNAKIGILSLSTGEWDVLADSGSFARYANTGHLLYLRANTLHAAPFDAERRMLTGPPFPVQDEVRSDLMDGGGFFAVSGRGALVYAPGTARPPPRTLVWVDRSGERSPIASAPRPYSSPRVSPDGEHLLLHLEEASISIWAYEIQRDTLSRVSFSDDDHTVAWSPDGARFAFESSRSGVHQIFIGTADGSGVLDQITDGEYDHFLCDWSADGRSLASVEFHPETAADLWILDPSGDRPPRPFLITPYHETQATFSPNGRWLAYASDESGQLEVYVRPVSGPGQKMQVSRDGGEEPAWSRSGDELYYLAGGQMLAVTVGETPGFTASRPEVLFDGPFHLGAYPSRSYDVAPDGRFIMVAEPAPEFAVHRLEVVLNWAGQLNALNR
jgi:Tol biopolymer transport system component